LDSYEFASFYCDFYFDHFLVENNSYFNIKIDKLAEFNGVINLTNGFLFSRPEIFNDSLHVDGFYPGFFSKNSPIVQPSVQKILLNSKLYYLSEDLHEQYLDNYPYCPSEIYDYRISENFMISFKDFFYNIKYFYAQLNIEQKQIINDLFLDKDFLFSDFNEEE